MTQTFGAALVAACTSIPAPGDSDSPDLPPANTKGQARFAHSIQHPHLLSIHHITHPRPASNIPTAILGIFVLPSPPSACTVSTSPGFSCFLV
ncbi:hypothetical protein PAAG_03650 [Paracoccidioides lutzii Pb01]|uniref:Uncharacterized protein n=1 Tax=Paracoccidioides lutzii (strain ATCC MYA-826 / Pb01) TaxID=502779 RepID=C1GXS7_PARBA|nr:hypothetical protein PAAG_03650 [Paracoccidioides lutzii Pb01]EEH41365.1 hypothetical protein PAAG_03650 [Paracoccidioides lutzii Pb01]